MKRLLTQLFCTIGLSVGFGLAAADDGCSDVLQKAGRNYIEDDYANATASLLYDQQCSGATYKNSGGFGASLEAIIDSIPLKFGATGSNDTERMSNFCRTYNSLLINNTQSVRISNTVVGESVRAWLECKRLASQGIDFRPAILRTQFTVAVRRTSGAAASITSVLYDSKLANCTVPENGKAAKATISTNIALVDDREVVISCIRSAVKKQDGAMEYPAIDLSIVTDRGTLALPVLQDAAMPELWASQIQSHITRTEKDLNDRMAKLNGRVSGIHLSESDRGELPSFDCGHEAIAQTPFTYAMGSRDGTSCSVRNIVYVKTLRLDIPQ
jgi:hypothetical protein